MTRTGAGKGAERQVVVTPSRNPYQHRSADEIIPGLWCGAWEAAPGFEGHVLCVDDEIPPPEFRHPAMIHLPILRFDLTQPITAVLVRLEAVVALLHRWRATSRGPIATPILVHCGAGIERSPLAVAWFLFAAGYASTLESAYVIIKAKRPCIVPRLEWLP